MEQSKFHYPSAEEQEIRKKTPWSNLKLVVRVSGILTPENLPPVLVLLEDCVIAILYRLVGAEYLAQKAHERCMIATTLCRIDRPTTSHF